MYNLYKSYNKSCRAEVLNAYTLVRWRRYQVIFSKQHNLVPPEYMSNVCVGKANRPYDRLLSYLIVSVLFTITNIIFVTKFYVFYIVFD